MATFDLTTVAAVKEAITLPDNNVDLDAALPNLISQASRAILNYCKREFAPNSTTATRRFRVDQYHVDLTPYDLQSASAVVLHPEANSVTLTSGQYMLKPINPQRGVYTSIDLSGYLVIISQTLMAFGYALLDITGTWGFPSIPEDVVRATNITVASWLTRTAPGASLAGYGIPQSAGPGMTLFRNDWHIPFAAKNLLGEYRRGSSRWAI